MATYVPVGVQQKFFAKLETTFDTVSAFASADAVPLVSLDFQPKKDYLPSKERVGTASLQREVAGEAGGTWTATFYVKPNGSSVTTEPDTGAFLKAAMGAVDTSSTVKYEFKDSSGEVETVSTLQIAKHVGKGRYEIINGAWVESMDIDLTGNAENMITVSGGFATFGYCYGATVSGSHSSADTTIDVDANDGKRIGVNSYIQFDDAGTVRDNSSAGYLVTAVTADNITISPGLEAGVADDTEIQPFTPAQTLTTNDPIFGSLNYLWSTDLSASLAMISGKVSIATGYHGLSAEGQYGKARRVARGERSVTGEANVYFISSDNDATDWSKFVGAAHSGETWAFLLGAGTTSMAALRITIPKARFNVSGVSDSEAEESTIALTFVARQSAAAGDECNIEFY